MTVDRRVFTSPFFPDLSRLGFVLGSMTWASQTWVTANKAVAIPVVFPAKCSVVAMIFRPLNTTGNFDMGLYNQDFTKIQSKGSTAMANARQTLTFTTPVPVVQNRVYYAAIALSSTSGTLLAVNGATITQRRLGLLEQASALALPDPFVPATITVANLPLVGFTLQGPF